MPPRGGPGSAPSWELARSQLHRLSSKQLDQLARRWLAALGFRAVGREVREDAFLAYCALIGETPLSLPVQARIYRRRHRLQPRHVDEFSGYLARTGHVAGIAVTTGAVAQDAARAAAQSFPPVRLLSGEGWLKELAGRRTGVAPCRLAAWIIVPPAPAGGPEAGTPNDSTDPGAPRPGCPEGGRW
jgi:hypothetical protein